MPTSDPLAAIDDSPRASLDWAVVAAVNNDALVESCLLSSPDVSTARQVLFQRGFKSAAKAFNNALNKVDTDLVVFAHQDVYFPAGWLARLQQALHYLQKHDRNWGVLGVWGVQKGGNGVGHVYCTGVGRLLGKEFSGVVEVQSLDEIVLVVRKSSGVRFDEDLRGFHMYGSDICLESRRRGRKAYAISAFCIHNTNGYNQLPLQFWRLYMQMRRKWKSELPISTSCIRITRGCYPMFRWIADRSLHMIMGWHKPGRRVDDPARLYRQVICGTEAVEPHAART